jgi:hypothetical protein
MRMLDAKWALCLLELALLVRAERGDERREGQRNVGVLVAAVFAANAGDNALQEWETGSRWW